MNKEKKKLLQEAEYPLDAPLGKHPAFLWGVRRLKENPEDRAVFRIAGWLEDELGFDCHKHRISEEALKALRYAVDHLAREWRAAVFHFRTDEALLPPLGSECYCVQGHPRLKMANPSWALRDIINRTGAVYPLDPGYYYLRVNPGGILSVEYKMILGGRTICTLTDAAP